MRDNEKKGTKGLFVLLFIMIGSALYIWLIMPMLEKEEVVEEKKEEKEEISLQEVGEQLYAKFTLTESEEYGITAEDETYLESKLSIYKMSDQLKVNLAIKNITEEYHLYDGKYSMKEAMQNMNGNFYYSGYYIRQSVVEDTVSALFGDVPFKHQTVRLRDKLYVYKDFEQYYEIWDYRNLPTYTEEKVTFEEVVVKDDEILVYEYVAYTEFKDMENIITRTLHSKNVGVVITDDNVADYLSYMDKYKYTFKKNKDGNYYFVSVEYMYE